MEPLEALWNCSGNHGSGKKKQPSSVSLRRVLCHRRHPSLLHAEVIHFLAAMKMALIFYFAYFLHCCCVVFPMHKKMLMQMPTFSLSNVFLLQFSTWYSYSLSLSSPFLYQEVSIRLGTGINHFNGPLLSPLAASGVWKRRQQSFFRPF